MKVYLAGTGIPMTASCIPAFRAAAALDRIGVHRLCDDPLDADAIVFTECHLLADPRLRPIVEGPLTRRFPYKTLVYDERDRPWCSLPGVYVSTPARWFDPVRQRAWAYYSCQDPSERDGGVGNPEPPDLLFSLLASPTHRSREVLFDVRHPRAVVERVEDFVFYDPESRDFAERRARFSEMVVRSKFVLCPRGRGTSSIRLYETLAAGRVPVVVSDEWVAPVGPDWDRIVLRWPEGRSDGLVEMLERHEPEFSARSEAARAAYVEWFAPDVAFHQIASCLEEVLPLAGSAPVRHGRDYRAVVAGEAWRLARIAAGSAKRRLTKAS